MLGHAGAIKHAMGLSVPGYFILFFIFILRNSQKQSKKIKIYGYTILSKGKHWRGSSGTSSRESWWHNENCFHLTKTGQEVTIR